jgi:integrase
MKCPYCNHAVPDESVFCMICGERIARKKREKKPPAKYPKYRVLADGSLLGQLMVNGTRETIKAENEKQYKAKIDALRSGIAEMKAHPEKRPLRQVLREYIDKNDGVLSPSTICGYEIIYKNRFKAYMPLPVGKIDHQAMVNDEAKETSPKTLKNAWGLVSASYRGAKIPVPEVNLPAIPESNEDFLDYEQIQTFLKAVEGDRCETAALLMLHGLRMSELLKLDAASDITETDIFVRGAMVPDKNFKLVEKKTNKNRTSTRTVPIVIPRLQHLIPESGKVVTVPRSTLNRRVVEICTAAGLPPCSPHDLRRSFASLGYHLKWSERTIMVLGGWSNVETVHKIYVKLSQKDVSADVQAMRDYYGFTTG